MTNQDLENIRAVAPWWAKWLCIDVWGCCWWQSTRGGGEGWDTKAQYLAKRMDAPTGFHPLNDSPLAIDLKTGDIHVQHAGKIVVATLAEWSAES